MSDIRFDHAPPPVSPFMPIFSPRGINGYVMGVILSHRTRGVLTHFTDGRTVPCDTLPVTPLLPALTRCAYCKAGLPRRWKGFLAIQESKTGRVGLLEITHHAASHARVLCDDAATLRGKKIVLRRAGNKRNGHVTATVEDYTNPNHPDLPQEPDVEGSLLRIWLGGHNQERSGK